MPVVAQSVIKEAQTLLQDAAGKRWPATDLVAHLTPAAINCARLRPDLFAVLRNHPLVAGVRQATPSDCVVLIDVKRNVSGAPVSIVDHDFLARSEPGWWSMKSAAAIEHVTYDPRTPTQFRAYPPAASGAAVELEFAATPACTAAASGPLFSAVTGSVSVPDYLERALLFYVMASAYAKDAEFGGNAALSMAYKKLFDDELMGDSAARNAVKPTVTDPTK